MPPTLLIKDALSRLNSVQPRMAAALIDSKPEAEVLAIVRLAMHEVGLKHEAAAAAAGVKPSQFSAALNGQGNFGATWLWAQDDRFLERFFELAISSRSLTQDSLRAVRRRRIVELIDLLLVECA